MAVLSAPAAVTRALELARSAETADDQTWQDATEKTTEWLLALPHATAESVTHWFCGRDGLEEAWGAAAFSVRLFGYKPQGQLAEWRNSLFRLLSSCPDCARAYQRAKREFTHGYLPLLKSQQAIAVFSRKIEEIELNHVLAKLCEAGLRSPPTSTATAPDRPVRPGQLGAVHPAVVHHCLVNHDLFQNDLVITALISGLPLSPDASTLALPPQVTPGLLALRLHSNDNLRQFAQAQLDKCELVDPHVYVELELGVVMDSHLKMISRRNRNESAYGPDILSLDYTISEHASWDGLIACLRVLSTDTIATYLVGRPGLDLPTLVASEVGAKGPQLEPILGLFALTLERLGERFWHNSISSEQHQSVVLHNLLDNEEWEDRFAELESGSPEQRYLNWIPPFLRSIANDGEVFPSALATLSSSLIDRIGGALRFDPPVRTNAIELGLNVLGQVFLSVEPGNESVLDLTGDGGVSWPHAEAALKTLDIHAQFITQLGFGPDYRNKPEWKRAHDAALDFVGRLALRDGRLLREAVYQLGACEAALVQQTKAAKVKSSRAPPPEGPSKPVAPKPLQVCSTLWHWAYQTVTGTDVEAIAALIRALRVCAHLEKVRGEIYANCTARENHALFKPQMRAINAAMDSMRRPITSLLMDFTDEPSATLAGFLRQPLVCESIVALLLSPVDELQSASQAYVKAAFDVDSRRECFHALLKSHPEPTLSGLLHALRASLRASQTLPEACGLAKRTVRCLVDVNDALCSHTDGLVRTAAFVSGKTIKTKLTVLWKLMTESLAIIFRQTPSWAEFFPQEEMTDWMRDAIGFGEDLLNQLRPFEIATGDEHKRRLSLLSGPLEELLAWLRLNDESLLASSFNLITSILDKFARYGVGVPVTVVKATRRIVEKGTKASSDGSNRSSLLRQDQLKALLEALETGPDTASDTEGTKPSAPSKARTSSLTLAGSSAPTSNQKDSWLKLMGQKPAPSAPTAKSKSNVNIPVLTLDDDDDVVRRPSKPKQPSATRPLAQPSASRPVIQPIGRFNSTSITRPIAPVARPRGVPWTTYSSKAAAPSASSDEEDSDDDGGPRGLALLAQAQNGIKPTFKKAEQRNKVQMLGVPGVNGGRAGATALGQRQRTAEEIRRANAAALRAGSDHSELHRKMLQWDPDSTSSLPPGWTEPPARVGPSFPSADAYFDAYEPLLLTECWAQIKAEIEAKNASRDPEVVRCTVASRQQVDDFVDISTTIEHGQLPDKFWINDNDLMLLQQNEKKLLAKVQSFTKKKEFAELTVRCHLGSDQHYAGQALSARTKWSLTKLTSLSTLHREYSALQSVRYLELFTSILSPQRPPILPFDDRRVRATMAGYKLNEPQAKAVLGSLQTRGFSLIQGPPGTGKTKTILGLIAAFIDARPRVSTAIHLGKPSEAKDKEPVAKVLLCAPSNAAVDEVAKRLKEGIRNSQGELFIPKVVRIGTDRSVDIAVKGLFIDELVEAALGNDSGGGRDEQKARNEEMAARQELAGLRDRRNALQGEREATFNNSARVEELGAELRVVKARMFQITQKLDEDRDKRNMNKRTLDAKTRAMRLQILSEADVICSTLSGSGHDYMNQLPFELETVIVDEAAQSVELSSLIPLRYGCQRCILVGDPLQLPPTVISDEAKRAAYDRSLFVRMMTRGMDSVHLLSIQYRMNPLISAFPSAAFYQSRLTDGPNMAEATKRRWHNSSFFPPYSFFDVKGKEERRGQAVLTNPIEAEVAAALVERLLRDFPGVGESYSVGVVTPYKGQVTELKNQFRRKFGDNLLNLITFNTIDAFQGQEKDIIILSCVRGGSAESSIGFLKDTRRMNVALTRAKSSLFILGDADKLRSNEHWRNLVQDAEARGLLRPVDAHLFRAASAPAIAAKPPPSAARSAAKPVQVDGHNKLPSVTPAKEVKEAQPTPAKASAFARAIAPPPKAPAREPTSALAKKAAERRAAQTQTQGTQGPAPMDIDLPPSKATAFEVSAAPPVAQAEAARPPGPPVRPRAAPSLFVPKKRPNPSAR